MIPRAVDIAKFSPAAVSADRIAALRRAWGIPPQMRVVLACGRIAPGNGQLSMIDALPLLAGTGERNLAIVFAGEDGGQQHYAQSLRRQARLQGVDALCRIVGPCADMPAALAAADVVVVVPALEPPLTGRPAAEAQAMGRPVVVTEVGVLPETVLCPPRMREEFTHRLAGAAGHRWRTRARGGVRACARRHRLQSVERPGAPVRRVCIFAATRC